MKKDQINVVITGADHPTGLGTARAIAETGTKIIGIYSNIESPCCKSRLWHQLFFYNRKSENLFEKLIETGKKLNKKSVLFPVQDSVVQLISENREELQKYFYFIIPSKKKVNLFLDKTSFHEWAIEHGFPVPESFIVSSEKELTSVLSKVKYPVIIKPYLKTKKWDILSPNNKAFLLMKKQDIDFISFNLFNASRKLIIQQWISGGDDCVHFCLTYFNRDGQELAYYTGKKLLQWPPYCGSTAMAVGTLNSEVHDLTKKLFLKACFCGIGSLEFKQNEEDKKYYIIEPTIGRNDLQSNVATAGGVNLTQIALSDIFAGKEKQINYRKSKGVWIEENGVIDAIRQDLTKTKFIFESLTELTTKKISFAYFNHRDPMPFFYLLRNKIYRKIGIS